MFYLVKHRHFILLGWLLVSFVLPIQAKMTIEITEGTESSVPIAVVPFAWRGTEEKAPVDISGIINADLSRSGYFKTLSQQDMLTQPSREEDIRFRNWQVLGQDYILIGTIRQAGRYFHIQFQLFDVYKEEQLLGYRLDVESKDLRRTAHQISDIVYQKLTGIQGVFSTRIAYITSVTDKNGKKRYKLQVADADGYNPITIASSSEPLMSPAWSPDGKKIAYVSFENRQSGIYIQTLATGKRVKVAGFPGINGAPSWSPDGTKLAMTLSKEGSPDIYVLDLNTGSFLRLTDSYAIDTEPSWAPDGSYLVFTSDRGGKPQLYKIPPYGGRATRLTFTGNSNAKGVISPDGKQVGMVHEENGDYRIAVMDLKTEELQILTDGSLDESPAYAPNGSMIIYASHKGNQGLLLAVSADGRIEQKLVFNRGEVREPVWSPVK